MSQRDPEGEKAPAGTCQDLAGKLERDEKTMVGLWKSNGGGFVETVKILCRGDDCVLGPVDVPTDPFLRRLPFSSSI